ncbi:hypothetical protein TIFTF001_020945 [Ficus carica]|uniref:Uncharacterized protein n=1 Tax=Ficus carica TaxID=3494 RepID=A0AA88DD52_FICCA|nr:hypothetical protein TIFTF001_020945 [Ficus carica]
MSGLGVQTTQGGFILDFALQDVCCEGRHLVILFFIFCCCCYYEDDDDNGEFDFESDSCGGGEVSKEWRWRIPGGGALLELDQPIQLGGTTGTFQNSCGILTLVTKFMKNF